jgi:hypothetical protein
VQLTVDIWLIFGPKNPTLSVAPPPNMIRYGKGDQAICMTVSLVYLAEWEKDSQAIPKSVCFEFKGTVA